MPSILLVGITIFKVQKQLKIPAGKCKINVTPYAISLFWVPNGLSSVTQATYAYVANKSTDLYQLLYRRLDVNLFYWQEVR